MIKFSFSNFLKFNVEASKYDSFSSLVILPLSNNMDCLLLHWNEIF